MVAMLSLKVPKKPTLKHFVGRLSNMSFTLVNGGLWVKSYSLIIFLIQRSIWTPSYLVTMLSQNLTKDLIIY